MRIGVEEEECVEQQAICFASLKRSMVAVLASYQRKTRVMETLRESSHKARLKTDHKAEDVACRHDVLGQQWYYLLRLTKCCNMENERKRIVAQ